MAALGLNGARYGAQGKVGKGPLAGVLEPAENLPQLDLRGHKLSVGADVWGNATLLLADTYKADSWGKLGRQRQPEASRAFADISIATLAQQGYFADNPHGAITETQRQNLPEVVNGQLQPDPASGAPPSEALFIGEVVFQMPPSPDGSFDGKMTALVCPQLRFGVLQRITSFNAQYVAKADNFINTLGDQIGSIIVNAVTFNIGGLLSNLQNLINLGAQFGNFDDWARACGNAAAAALGQAQQDATPDAKKALQALKAQAFRIGQTGPAGITAQEQEAADRRKKYFLVGGVGLAAAGVFLGF